MDIIPGILTENEFKFFTKDTYKALEAVADDVICAYLNAYIESPGADALVVKDMHTYMGEILKRYRLNERVLREDILQYIDSLVPETMVMQEAGVLRQIVDKLQFLEESYTDLVFNISPRSKEAFKVFANQVDAVINTMHIRGVSTTYPNVKDRLVGNSILFYVPNAKTKLTGVGRIGRIRRKWILSLQGAKYLLYCEQNGINTVTRRSF